MTEEAVILIVEDHSPVRESLVELLEQHSAPYKLRVLAAPDGRSALELIQQTPPDLIISDVVMPKMDGLELLTRVRRNPAWFHIPVILLSASGVPYERVKRDRQISANLYVTKSVIGRELLELVDSQLERAFALREVRLREADNLQKGILQLLNHEFRTPLTYVMTYAEMLADSVSAGETEPEDFQAYLEGIQAGCVRLTRLIEGLLRVVELRSKETQSAVLHRAAPITDLNAILQEVVAQQPQWPLRGQVSIDFRPTAALPSVFGDRASLQTIFAELLDNAVKFSVLPYYQNGRVTVRSQRRDDEVCVIIEDNGPGIPAAVQPRIFELFYQYNRANYEQQGAGVGLSIAQALVELHNGRLEVASVEGEGTTITVCLPVYDAQQGDGVEPETAAKRQATVLIVEDDENLLYGLRDLLELDDGRYAFEVITATGGPAALEHMATETPHLIVCDIMMPEMDGFTFLQTVRQNEAWLDIPIIFLTARSTHEDQHRGLRSGAEEYITKPYEVDELLSLIYRQLNRYFTARRLLSHDFEALKHEIIGLLPAWMRMPLETVSEQTGVLAQESNAAASETALKRRLQEIRGASVQLTRQVESYIALVELQTGEAQLVYQLQAAVLHDAGLIPLEAGEFFQRLSHWPTADVQVDQEIALPLVYGVNELLMKSLAHLVAAGLQALPETAPRRARLSVSYDTQDIYYTVRFAAPLPAEEAERLRRIMADERLEAAHLATYGPSLRIALGYMDLHNGRIAFRNDPVAMFTVTLPVHRDDTAPVRGALLPE